MTDYTGSFNKINYLINDIRSWEKDKMNEEKFKYRANIIRNILHDLKHILSGYKSIQAFKSKKIIY